ncbi:hypothetical protein EDB86DRAFT_2299572 [Lactarius hatsudake]|nr:hypothetical protein EDB86DRAFT_2299572 [Lactarius hatsudake]
MGQIASRHRPLSHNPTLSSTTHSSSSSTRVADQSSSHSSRHNSDLSNQAPLPSKRSNRRSFLGTLRSPLRHQQRTSTPQGDAHRVNAHKRWTLYGRRRPSEPARAPPDQLPGYDEAQQPGESSRVPIVPPSSPPPSNPATATTTTTADLKGKAKEDNPAASAAELVNATMPGPSSSGSSPTDPSQPNSMPFLGTATDVSSSSTSSPPASRDPVAALNHDPRPLPTISIGPDSTPNWARDNPEPFDVMERPATPPDPAQAPPPETRRNFPAAGTLVVVQGVVHTSDVSQSNSAEPSDTASHPASSAPPSGERPSRRRFSDLLSRPIRSRRSSYAAPESHSSETTASTETENQEESSATSEASQEQPVQDDPPVPASRPLSLSPTSIDVLGTLLSVATAATAASLVSGSSDPLLTSGLALPGMQGMQPTPSSPMSEQGHGLGHSHSLSQSSSQGQSRPLSPTPTAGLASRDRVRNAWAGLRDRLGLRPSSPTSAPVSPPAMSPSPEPEPPLIPGSPTTPVDPRTQLLADMARAFQMGMGLDDTPGSGSRSGDAAQASPAIEVSLGDGQQRQQQAQQQERPPPAEDSFERFLMDLQVDLRRTLEDGQPEAEPEAERAPDRGQDAEPSRVDVPPLVYPQESPLSVANLASADIEGLPALPPDNDDLLSDDELDADDEDDREPEAETAAPSSSQPESRPTPEGSQTPRRTIAGSERRPGGGINWWRMYRFPPMVVPHGSGAPGSAPSPTSPLSPSPPTFPSTEATATATATGDASAAEGQQRNEALPTSPDLQGAQTQDGNTVVPVIVVGLQSVHGHGHGHAAQGHRHAEEHPPLPPPLLPQQDQTQDNEHALQDELAGELAAETPRDRERERRWSTRAADALRGFRPAPGAGTARHESSAPGAGAGEGGARTGDDGHGSTTFFIYVIGGYYPPNHQLVVGTDPLDSFEELAELLGQVKPPTATKEDIDNSGLEVIRSGVLVEYEKVGRIAPMCVDRCLICLEDYDPEEDLRLLSCRHVFHRDCVDRWLETGRNNCPACRSQGVTTNPGSIPIPSSA